MNARSHAEAEGREAWLDDRAEIENPYPHGTSEHDDWAKGWLEASERTAELQPSDCHDQ